jgi:hypothetical protein
MGLFSGILKAGSAGTDADFHSPWGPVMGSRFTPVPPPAVAASIIKAGNECPSRLWLSVVWAPG